MLSPGAYLLGVVLLVAVALSLGCSAVLLRRRLLPDWEGAPAHLVEAILAIALLLWLSEALGAFNLFRAWTLVASSLILLALLFWRFRPSSLAGLTWRLRPSSLARPPLSAGGAEGGDHPRGATAPQGGGGPTSVTGPADAGGRVTVTTGPAGPGGVALLVTIGVIALVAAHWGLTTKDALDRGIFNFDSLWYHMPFAVDMVQSHSVTALHHTDTVFTNWFYPQNSELLHAVGILLSERDTLSLFLNFGWLAVAFLAAWCIGRPYGRGPLTVLAAAILLECHTLVVREPGAAKNDLMAAALLLAAIAILVTAWTGWATRTPRQRGDQGVGEAPAGARRSLPLGWPLAAAGLAVGLAVGTKFTVLAMAAALTIAMVVLAPAGRRLAAAGWWFLPALAGGGFWYLRNLIAVGNPLPQIQDLGPIALPGPERLQTARPDFSIAHYATDTGVWGDYFVPGLHDQFGLLWPLVLGGAVLGAALIAIRGDRLQRWLGGMALFGLLAYVFTPLSAAGAEGAPVAFEINLRFAIASLLLGLVLLPLALFRTPRSADEPPPADGPETTDIATFPAHRRRFGRWEWGMAAALLFVLVLSDRADAVVRDPARLFGISLAILLVLIPAALLYARRRASLAVLTSGFALLFLAIAAIGYPVQRDYLTDRFANKDPETSIPGFGLDAAYRWARDRRDARIGLAGTTAGFLQYGFYGTDLSNRVVYLGREGPKGAFDAIQTCGAFRAAVNSAQLDYLVTAPFLNFIETGRPIPSPEAGWLLGETAVEPVLSGRRVAVWRIAGRLDPRGCGPDNAPLRALPNSHGSASGDASAFAHTLAPRPPRTAGPILAARPRLAIVGDSYSAGEGADVYFEGSDTDDSACHRSPYTYLAQAFRLSSERVLACSGAATADITSEQAGRSVDPQVVQLARLRDAKGVDAVVLTLGGNDVGFRDVVESCLFVGSCAKKIYTGPLFRRHGVPAAEFVAARIAPLPRALEAAYRAIDRVVNDSRPGADAKPVPILVLAYPLPTPPVARDCDPMFDQLEDAELRFLDKLLHMLNDTVRGAVDRTRASGVPVFFVPETAAAFQPDHTVCDSEPYARSLWSFNGGGKVSGRRLIDLPLIQLGRFKRGIQELVHPNRSGYAAISDAVLRWSRGPEAVAADRLLAGPGS